MTITVLAIAVLLLVMIDIGVGYDHLSLKEDISEQRQALADQRDTIERLTFERDELLRQKQSLTETHVEEQNRTKRGLSGAEIRRRVERANAAKPEPTQAEKLAN